VSVALLELVETSLAGHSPNPLPLRASARRCAVAVILQLRGGDLAVLMIKRAEREGDPWSGHMAFPGGRKEPQDRNGYVTAVRETWEEIGLQLGPQDRCVGKLSDLQTHPNDPQQAMVVTPFVFILEREVMLSLNYEVADVLWVPLNFLLNAANRQSMLWHRGDTALSLPCYHFSGQRIWGMSLRMLDELMALMQASG
jgi:8-oxo-dGTP pyrophosphatase MutT (NUDIX family)